MRLAWIGVLALLAVAAADDAEERREEIRKLAKEPGEGVSAKIAKALSHRDPEVRKTALDALGGRKDATALKALRRALKSFAKDKDLLPVVVVSLGASEDAKSAKAVADLARKSVGSDARLARACIDALGGMRATEGVDCLVTLLAAATDARGASHPELRDDLMDSLGEVTDLPFRKPSTFVDWWRKAKGRWEGAPPEPPEKGKTYRSDGWRFRIDRPDEKRWVFKKVEGAVVRVSFAGPKDEAGFAWVDVMAHAAAEQKPETLAKLAADRRKWMEESLKDPRDPRWSFRTKLGSAPAIGHEAVGVLASGHVVKWRIFCVQRNGLLLTVSAHMESGASEAVAADFDRILGSFKLLDR
jgi:hypothetical protein